MTPASNSEGRKRHDARLLAAIESLKGQPSTGLQDWAYARTCQPCQRDHITACTGVAWDVDELAVINCLCGCPGDEKNITRGEE